nr:hypothetical protein [Mycoplasmopsis agalactiae]
MAKFKRVFMIVTDGLGIGPDKDQKNSVMQGQTHYILHHLVQCFSLTHEKIRYW